MRNGSIIQNKQRSGRDQNEPDEAVPARVLNERRRRCVGSGNLAQLEQVHQTDPVGEAAAARPVCQAGRRRRPVR